MTIINPLRLRTQIKIGSAQDCIRQANNLTEQLKKYENQNEDYQLTNSQYYPGRSTAHLDFPNELIENLLPSASEKEEVSNLFSPEEIIAFWTNKLSKVTNTYLTEAKKLSHQAIHELLVNGENGVSDLVEAYKTRFNAISEKWKYSTKSGVAKDKVLLEEYKTAIRNIPEGNLKARFELLKSCLDELKMTKTDEIVEEFVNLHCEELQKLPPGEKDEIYFSLLKNTSQGDRAFFLSSGDEYEHTEPSGLYKQLLDESIANGLLKAQSVHLYLLANKAILTNEERQFVSDLFASPDFQQVLDNSSVHLLKRANVASGKQSEVYRMLTDLMANSEAMSERLASADGIYARPYALKSDPLFTNIEDEVRTGDAVVAINLMRTLLKRDFGKVRAVIPEVLSQLATLCERNSYLSPEQQTELANLLFDPKYALNLLYLDSEQPYGSISNLNNFIDLVVESSRSSNHVFKGEGAMSIDTLSGLKDEEAKQKIVDALRSEIEASKEGGLDQTMVNTLTSQFVPLIEDKIEAGTVASDILESVEEELLKWKNDAFQDDNINKQIIVTSFIEALRIR